MKRSTANNQRPVTQFTLEDVELETFDSIVIAGRKTGIDRRTINGCVLGHSKTAGGFKWKYFEKEID